MAADKEPAPTPEALEAMKAAREKANPGSAAPGPAPLTVDDKPTGPLAEPGSVHKLEGGITIKTF